ncbi:MAG: ferritin family protein [Syntrophobacterales bacterium]|nr:ferritin family protein [Syntrophobacterales bacterium]
MNEDLKRAMKMLSTALEMEERGRAFYQRAVSTCKNDMGKEIFQTLMEDEDVHMVRIKSIYEILSKQQAWSENWKELNGTHDDLGLIFEKMAKKRGAEIDVDVDTNDLEALDTGIDVEARSVEFYEKQLIKAIDPLEQEFIRKMVIEEKGHYAALTDMKFYLFDPAGWFREKEHGGLDGG